jgi:hypothetical protein
MIFVILLMFCAAIAWNILGHYIKYAEIIITEEAYAGLLTNMNIAYHVATLCSFVALLIYVWGDY